MKNIKPWPYAKLITSSPNSKYGTSMRLKGGVYYRDSGSWSIGYEVKGNRIFAKSTHEVTSHLHGREFVKITKKEWSEENG